MQEFISILEATEKTGVADTTIRRWIKKGLIKTEVRGNMTFVDPESIRRVDRKALLSRKPNGLSRQLNSELDNQLGNLDNKQIQVNEVRDLIAKNRGLESQVSTLTDRVKVLEERLSSQLDNQLSNLSNQLSNQLPGQLGKQTDTTHCLGFQLVQKIVKGQLYWYGVKTIEKKTVWVYIGSDKDKASAKITEWLRNNPEIAAKLS